MTRATFLLGVTVIAVTTMATVDSARAQGAVAVVETWQGGSVRIAQPSLETLYTIIPPATPGGGGAVPAATGMGAVGYGTAGRGAPTAASLGASPPPVQARLSYGSLTLVRNGVEVRLPLDRISSLVVERRAAPASSLPPWVKPTHVTSTAKAVLTDGSTIDGASVNFGTSILRGTGPQGTIELPLEDVKTLQITR